MVTPLVDNEHVSYSETFCPIFPIEKIYYTNLTSLVPVTLSLTHSSRSLNDRWGIKHDRATTFLHSSLSSAFRRASPNPNPVHSGSLSTTNIRKQRLWKESSKQPEIACTGGTEPHAPRMLAGNDS